MLTSFPSAPKTNSKLVPNMPIGWDGASDLLPGLVRAELGPEWGWDGNEKRSSLAGHETGTGGRDKRIIHKILWALSFLTMETHISPL